MPDGGVPGGTLFPRLASGFISSQIYFNQHMTAAILAIHRGGGAWTLLLLSFLYGVVHAIGPGHGKAVVSSYLLATRQTLRNGILLAFVAALVQALGAIILIFVAALVLHLTSVSITQVTARFEVVSGLLVLLLGCWLVWSKIVHPLRSASLGFEPSPALIATQRRFVSTADQARFQASAVTDSDPAPPPAIPSAHSADTAAASRRFPVPHGMLSRIQCSCGQIHMPDANMTAARVDWRKVWPILGATALRPCTGALIVLVFAISQRLWGVGILSTLLMGLGTAMTVSAIAILTVFAHRFAVALTSADSQFCHRIVRGIEICGAVIVLGVGVFLVGGSL
ncbi:MAG TPA: delayed-early response protein/equilibrative nucleoside transporter [Xanthobacteraceae bacterium]|nr:delayed-early response protein/equilibrative nucleoside transporter [Xanthobacteraceae bacterium]